MNEVTVGIVKPGAVKRGGYEQDLFREFDREGLECLRSESVTLTKAQAEDFYAEHRGKPFFEGLIQHAISGPCRIFLLSGNDAVARWREIIGPTDPNKGIGLRNLFGTLLPDNGFHGSDSLESANREMRILFPSNEAPLPVIKFKKLDPEARIPTKATPEAAGMDLYALEDAVVSVSGVTKVRTGLAMSMPPGYEAQARTRSGMGAKGIVVSNSPGTIDSDYRGELFVLLASHYLHDYRISKGDRIAQLVIHKLPEVTVEEVTELDPTERGDKGFGSSGR